MLRQILAPLVLTTSAAAQTPQPSTPAVPQFDVVSVKPCGQSGAQPPSEGRGAKGANSVRSGPSPSTLYIGCIPVRVMLVIALGSYRTGQIEGDWNSHGLPLEIEGGPSWIGSDQYIVEAKTSANVSQPVLRGPMLRAVLEDRFQLKTHRETRDVPVFELTVAKGGLKLQRPGDLACTEPLYGGPPRDGRSFLPLNCSKLQRTEPGSCVEREPGPAQEGEKPRCGDSPALIAAQRITYDVFGGTLRQAAGALRVDKHPVIDRTGLTDLFNVHLEYTPDNAPPTDTPDGAPTIFTALAQLGLKLEPSHAAREFFVIDRLERPTGN